MHKKIFRLNIQCIGRKIRIFSLGRKNGILKQEALILISALNRPSLLCISQEADSFLLFGDILFPNALWKSKLVKTMTKVKKSVNSVHFSRSRLFVITLWRVRSLFWTKNSRTPFGAKKSLEATFCFFTSSTTWEIIDLKVVLCLLG